MAAQSGVALDMEFARLTSVARPVLHACFRGLPHVQFAYAGRMQSSLGRGEAVDSRVALLCWPGHLICGFHAQRMRAQDDGSRSLSQHSFLFGQAIDRAAAFLYISPFHRSISIKTGFFSQPPRMARSALNQGFDPCSSVFDQKETGSFAFGLGRAPV